MKSSTRIFMVLSLLMISILLLPVTNYAEIIEAASASRNDVAAAINAASYGDTVTIPACASGDCIWTSGIEITKDIKIVGAGIDRTILALGFTDDNVYEAFFEFKPDARSVANLDSLSDAYTFEVTGITFSGNDRMRYKYGVWIYSYKTPLRRIKIHHNKFTSIARAVQTDGNVYGVFYNNTLINTNAAYPSAYNEYSWNDYPMSPGSGDGWYIEDNTFTNAPTISGGGHGMGHVVRYNTVTGAGQIYVESHGNQLAGINGTQITEVYGNNFIGTANQGFDMRGGKCIIFFNKDNDDSHHVREEFPDSSSPSLNNVCPENKPQICEDGCVSQKVNHSYMWNNRNVITNKIQRFKVMDEDTNPYDRYDNVNINDPRELLENREFFTQRPTGTFDGSGDSDKGGGCGCGTLAEMNAITPKTKGVGFWVTNQSCTDLTNYVGANPATPISGTLYRAVPDGAGYKWEEFYTPYKYPHPLRGPRPPQMQEPS